MIFCEPSVQFNAYQKDWEKSYKCFKRKKLYSREWGWIIGKRVRPLLVRILGVANGTDAIELASTTRYRW